MANCGSSLDEGFSRAPRRCVIRRLAAFAPLTFGLAAGLTGIAFLLSLSTHVTFTLLASLVSFLAALLTLIAFAIDIALYAFVKHQMGKLTGVIQHTNTGPGASS